MPIDAITVAIEAEKIYMSAIYPITILEATQRALYAKEVEKEEYVHEILIHGNIK